MPYRKKGVRITYELLEEILNEVKEKFNESEAPEYLKKKLKKINPVFFISNKKRTDMVGGAVAINRYAKKDLIKNSLKLKRSIHPTVTLLGEVYFLIIEVNKGGLRCITHRGLRYLVAHELAHLLQVVLDEEVDGSYSYSTPNDHDERWYRFTKWMGGTGSDIIPFNEIWV
jgi:hypothetical protein